MQLLQPRPVLRRRLPHLCARRHLRELKVPHPCMLWLRMLCTYRVCVAVAVGPGAPACTPTSTWGQEPPEPAHLSLSLRTCPQRLLLAAAGAGPAVATAAELLNAGWGWVKAGWGWIPTQLAPSIPAWRIFSFPGLASLPCPWPLLPSLDVCRTSLWRRPPSAPQSARWVAAVDCAKCSGRPLHRRGAQAGS